MRTKLTIAAIALMAVLCGCEGQPQYVKQTWGYKRIYIDTLTLHGNTHEVLIRCGGGMMHSPECWCKD